MALLYATDAVAAYAIGGGDGGGGGGETHDSPSAAAMVPAAHGTRSTKPYALAGDSTKLATAMAAPPKSSRSVMVTGALYGAL